jgi:hypothetical protein
MSQKQAAWTSVGEFLQRREAYEKRQQLEWERSRWIAYSIFSPFLGKNKPRTPQQWVKFPWEHKKQTAPMVTINESQIKTLNDIFIDFQKKKA